MMPGGVIEQYDGYFALPHIDIHAIPVSEFLLYDHGSYNRIYRTDMIKQPDVQLAIGDARDDLRAQMHLSQFAELTCILHS